MEETPPRGGGEEGDAGDIGEARRNQIWFNCGTSGHLVKDCRVDGRAKVRQANTAARQARTAQTRQALTRGDSRGANKDSVGDAGVLGTQRHACMVVGSERRGRCRGGRSRKRKSEGLGSWEALEKRETVGDRAS